MEEESYLLSLDASSSIIGYSIFNIKTKELVKTGYFIHNKEKNLLERVFDYEKLLNQLLLEYNITEFVIEEAFAAFFGGGSSANTIGVLTAVNFGYQLITAQKNIKINTISVHEARKGAFPGVKIKTLAKLKKQKEKEYCFDLALNQNPDLKKHLQTKIISKGKNKGVEVYHDWCADLIDSWITGIGFLNLKK
jgi:hypothetical protein